jgi:hypothetical protein
LCFVRDFDAFTIFFHVLSLFPLTCPSAFIAGGGVPEIEIALKLAHHAQTLTGAEAYCMRAFAEALEVCGAC